MVERLLESMEGYMGDAERGAKSLGVVGDMALGGVKLACVALTAVMMFPLWCAAKVLGGKRST